MKTYPLLLKPYLAHPIWSGDKLRTQYHIESDRNIGEAFNMSTIADAESIATNGVLAGKKLNDILKEFPEFTSAGKDRLDLLFKLIDTNDLLSVQVHPNDSYSLLHENQLGKSESWYVLQAESDAYIYLGFDKECSREKLNMAIQNNTVEKLLRKISVKQGDYFYIPSGTVHALGKGITICEIQQSSMVTYRLYDYARRDSDGNLRPLHIDKALDVSNYNYQDINSLYKPTKKGIKNTPVFIDSTPYFTMSYMDINEDVAYVYDDYTLMTVISGEGEIEYEDDIIYIAKGNSVFVPTNCPVLLSGEMELIINTPPLI